MRKSDFEQLYAEARIAFETSEPWWLDTGVEAIADAEQDKRLEPEVWEEPIARFASAQVADDQGERWISTAEVLQHLNVTIDNRTKAFLWAERVPALSGVEQRFECLAEAEDAPL